jgi:hypothetical protein
MKRPLLALPGSVRTESTRGSQYMYTDTLKEYVGDYHIYKTGAIYSDAEYNPKTSKELIKFIEPLQNPICQTYLKVSRKLFTDYAPPEIYYKIILQEEYLNGFVERYVVQKRNEPHRIFEVDKEQFKTLNRFNLGGLNEYVYRRDKCLWRITGDPEYVLDWNLNVLAELEKTIPGVGTYLFTDPTEFLLVKYDMPIDNRYTSGGQYNNSAGSNFVGLYHIREDLVPYEGPKEISGVDRILFPV